MSSSVAGGVSAGATAVPTPKVTTYLMFVMLVVTLGPIQYGYHIAELNAPQDVITCAKNGQTPPDSSSSTFPSCIPMTPAQVGLVSSSYTLGGFIGALVAGPFSTRYGRLLALRFTTIFFFVGPAFATEASSVGAFVTGRIISGLGAGAAIVVGPIYIAEIAPPHLRGFFGCFTQIGACVGILITQTLGLFLSRGNLWRLILVAAAVIAVLEGLGLLLVPDSPIWLAERGKGVLARRILQRIRGGDANIDAEVATWTTTAAVEGTEEEALLAQPTASSDPTTTTAAAAALPQKQAEVTMLGALRSPRYRPAILA
ncbi:hypothetical protein KEM56_006178, partial [Ascosphaera pollenicola]